MKLLRAALGLAFSFFFLLSYGQVNSVITLRSGNVSVRENIQPAFIDSFNKNVARFDDKSIVLLGFDTNPGVQERQQLAAAGIQVYNYIAPGIYSAVISGNAPINTLQQAKVKALIPLMPSHKIDPLLKGSRFPNRTIKVPGSIDVIISFPAAFSFAAITQFLQDRHMDIVSARWSAYGMLSVRIAPNRLQELASFPFVEYVAAAEPELELFNHKSRKGSRANFLNATVANGGLGLNGEGVVLGIGDNSAIITQADFTGRLMERHTTNASHGIHVAGTAAGGGIVNELHRGYAPKATIVNASQTDILSGIYVHDHNMVLTNNSYGPGFGCDFNGSYEGGSHIIDQMAIDFPSLLNVFGAGNYGTGTCAPYPQGFNTHATSYQSGKNCISVGATTDSGEVSNFSSKGPAKDGRIKPEIVTMGYLVTSTWPNNIYANNAGTSMSAPAVTGGLALLYQRYRQLHGGTDPKNGLMKAIICNGATDRGNNGPDYTNGFGWMNLWRSVDMLNKQHHFTANATHQSNNTHTITIPAGTAQVKVMVYWNDPVPSPLAKASLVNDLDLEVVTPSSAVALPFLLDTLPVNVNKPAVTGVDHINNIEQVVIDNPAAGNYTVRVKGTAITQNPSQEYFVVYDIIPVSATITFPVGGESMVPGESVKITWDAHGNADKTFTLQFSADNGATWTDISTNVAAARRIFTWQVPAVVTSNALVRVIQDGTALVSTSRAFTIIGLPVASLSAVQCETYIAIDWTAVAGADRYEVMMLQGDEMKVIDTTSATYYKFTNLSRENTYWVAVRSVINGKSGRRSVAISRKPDSGNCAGSISDNDLLADTLLSPATGRKNTSIALTANHLVTIRIKNLDDAPVSGLTASYSINNGPWITENLSTPIPAGGVYVHSFAAKADLSSLGSYIIKVAIKNNTPDPTSANDTLEMTIRQLDNQPIDLTNSFIDDLESATSYTYNKDMTGLTGVERYDFQSVTKSGQVTTFFNTGFAASGSKSFIMGEILQHPGFGLNYLTGTFNLSNYTALSNDLRADFKYVNTHFTVPNMAFWIRGADNQPWIKVFDMTRSPDTLYRRTPSIAIADSLAKYGQDFTPSFQMIWGNSSFFQSYDKRRMHGIDDIRLYQAVNDVQVIKIDTPSVMSCNVTGNVPVILRIHNSHFSTLTNVPVKYAVNGGQWIEEIVPAIPGKTTIQYTFSQTMNMTSNGTYKLKAVVSYPGDNFRDNDTLQSEIQSSVLMSQYPNLQDFESGQEGWYANGQNNSWEYGTPASPKIKGAASGAKAWKTKLSGNHNDNEHSYLYSPCFSTTGMARPMLSMSIAWEMDGCNLIPCDGAWVEYTTNGTSWLKLGTPLSHANWYNSGANVWSVLDYTRWHVASCALPASPTGLIRFRFVLLSNVTGAKEGIAIDDIHVYDAGFNDIVSTIYDSATMTSPLSQPVSGNDWADFRISGKLLASINPHGQDLGMTDVQVYIDSGSVRNTGIQYYHNRSLTLKSAKAPADSISVRFYFLDRETDSLIFATGCPTCTKPAHAYQLGVSAYNDPSDNFENGTIADNKSGTWSFINATNVKKVPFDKGYYAEFKIKDLSELWLNNGGHDLHSHLATQLVEFTAQRMGERDVLLSWRMGSEENIARFEPEMARDHAAVLANQFTRIGQVTPNGLFNYNFIDNDPDKFDTVYYRMKIVHSDGRFSYSPVRSVIFTKAALWTLYPNPSSGKFYLDYSAAANEVMFVNVFDAKGSLIKSISKQGSGFMQKLTIDLSDGIYAKGVYLMRVRMGGSERTFKLYKQ